MAYDKASPIAKGFADTFLSGRCAASAFPHTEYGDVVPGRGMPVTYRRATVNRKVQVESQAVRRDVVTEESFQ